MSNEEQKGESGSKLVGMDGGKGREKEWEEENKDTAPEGTKEPKDGVFSDDKGNTVDEKEVLGILVNNMNGMLMHMKQLDVVVGKVMQIMEIMMKDHGIEIDPKTGQVVRNGIIKPNGVVTLK